MDVSSCTILRCKPRKNRGPLVSLACAATTFSLSNVSPMYPQSSTSKQAGRQDAVTLLLMQPPAA